MIRRLVGRLVGALAAAVSNVQVAMVDRRAGRGPLVVLDVDNTLADAWPSFLTSTAGHRARLAGLDPLPEIKAVAHDLPLARGATVVFLSHRNVWEWDVTYRWLRRWGFDARWWNVVLVPTASAKVPIVQRWARGRDVAVWDDCSWGHERGTISFHDDVVSGLVAAGVQHHGWDEIVAITGRGLDREGLDLGRGGAH